VISGETRGLCQCVGALQTGSGVTYQVTSWYLLILRSHAALLLLSCCWKLFHHSVNRYL